MFILRAFGLSCLLIAHSALAAVVGDDPFTDGNRSGGTDAQGFVWFQGQAGAQLTVADDSAGLGNGNALRFAPDSDFHKFLAFFPAPVTLAAAGDTLSVAYTFRYATAPASQGDGIRAGFFHSAGTRQTTDTTGTTRSDDKGYLFGTNPGFAGTSTGVKREDAGNDVLGGASPGGIIGFGSSGTSFAGGTSAQTARFQISRMSNGDLQVSARLNNGTPASGVEPAASVLTYSFDTFTLGVAGTGYRPTMLLDDVRIESVNLPIVSIATANAAEAGLVGGSFTLTRVNAASALTIGYTTAGTAVAGKDYAPLAGSVTFAAGETTAVIPVLPAEDYFVEGNETVVLTVASSPEFVAASASATVTITDDPAATLPSDRALFASMDLSAPGLAAVQTAVQAEDYASAKSNFAAYLRARSAPVFPWSNYNPNATTLANALQHKYTVVGTTHDFEPEPVTTINWSFNPTNPLNSEWVWQFNRHSWWADLAQAWVNNPAANGAHLNEFLFELNDWIATSPAPAAINNSGTSRWRTIDSAIRVLGSWPGAFYRVKSSPALTDELLIKWVKSFYMHARHLEAWPTGNGNWRGIEARGLFTVGTIFPEFSEAAGWRALAVNRMESMLSADVFPDGAQFEITPGYHDNIISDVESLKRLAEANSLPTSAFFDSKLEQMYAYLAGISEPNRSVPVLNDSWPLNISGRMASGLVTFPERSDFQWIATNGAAGDAPDFTSRLYPQAGHAVMRSGWGSTDSWALLEAGPYGYAHQHEDKLGLSLDGYGQRHIMDAGTYDYDASIYRAFCLSSHAQSQPIIDGLNQNRAAQTAAQRIAPSPMAWKSSSRFDYTSGAYGIDPSEGWGPSRLRPATTKRHVFFMKPDVWVVIDDFKALDANPHTYTGLFHLNDDTLDVDPATQRITVQLLPGEMDPWTRAAVPAGGAKPSLTLTPLVAGGQTLTIVKGQDTGSVLGWRFEKDTTWKKWAIPTARFDRTIAGDTQMAYVLAASPATASPRSPGLTAVAADAGSYAARISPTGNAADDVIFAIGLDGENTSWQGTIYPSPALVVQGGAVYQWASAADPTIAITSPAPNAVIGSGPVQITVAAADSDGTVAKVEFFDGATKIGESLAAPFTFSWNNPLPGSHVLTAVATDNGGHVVTSAPVSIGTGPGVSIAATQASASEAGAGPGTFTISRDSSAGILIVDFTVSGTAEAGVDFQPVGSSVTFADGESAKTVTITPSADFFRDPSDTVILAIAPGAYRIEGPGTATVTIADATTTPFAVIAKNPLATTPGGMGVATRSVVSVSGQAFTQALRIVTPDTSVDPYQQGYGSAADIPLAQAVSAGDVLVLRLWARAIAGDANGEAFLRPRIESTGSVVSGGGPVTVGPEWRLIEMPVTMAASYPAGGARLRIFAGFGPQTLEIGGVSVLNHGAVAYNTLGISFYTGREAGAAWRAAAAQRIEQHRKANLTVQVRDLGGNPIPGATVRARLKRHAFGFGSAVAGSRIASTDTSEAAYVANQAYREKAAQFFHWAVLENEMKWPSWEPAKDTIASTTAFNALGWMRDRGFTGLRGHVLLWPGWNYLPAWLKTEYEAQVAANGQPAGDAWLRNRVLAHIGEQTAAVGNRVSRWDVLNEPFTNHLLMDIFGRSEMGAWFSAARAAAPTQKLVLNDYEIEGEDLPHVTHTLRTLQELAAAGAPVDGLGLQSHLGIRNMPGPERVLTVLDRYAATGKELEITEFDVSTGGDEQLQADYLRDFLTITFSHPAVKSFLHWGFWEGAHWEPTRALYRLDWSPKPAAQVWETLTRQTWWTDETAAADANGNVTVRGFLGDYEITATTAGRANVVSTQLSAAGATIAVVPRDQKTVTLNPSADAYARDGGNAGTVYGNSNAGSLEVKSSTLNSGFTRDAYLKFNLSTVPEIFSAKLRLSASASIVNGSTATYRIGLSAHAVADTAWSETTLTWNNRPALGAVIANGDVSGTMPAPSAQWVELDVTDHLRTEKLAGRDLVSLGLHCAIQATPVIGITSKDNANSALRPQLIITTARAPTVTVATTVANGAELGAVPARITLSRTGDSSVPLTVAALLAGSAVAGTDFSIPSPYVFPAGAAELPLEITPIPDSAAEGNETVTFTLQAGSDYLPGVPAVANVTIADKPYDAWRWSFGLAASSETADLDRDGFNTLLEYAQGSNPLVSGVPAFPTVARIGGQLTLSYQRLRDPAELSYVVEVSGNLVGWDSGTGFVEEILQPDGVTVFARDLQPASSPRRFIRLRVIRLP